MFNKLMDYANKKEMRESRDEVVIGQMIASMARMGYPTIAYNTGTALDTGFQAILFATPGDDVLHTVQVTLDRKTGGGKLSEAVIGSKATLSVIAEVKNYLADPDDLLTMWRTDFANITKMPMLGHVKLDHRLNSVLATKTSVIELSQYDGPEDRERIDQLLHGMIAEVRQAVAQYKKHSPFEQDIGRNPGHGGGMLVAMSDKREEIAWLAADTIAERGLAGASLREVAARTGASLGVVTYHFNNRDDLLAATMETVVAAIRRRASAARDPDPVERELAVVLPLTAATRRETAVWVAFSDAATRDARLAAQFEGYYKEWEDAVAAALAESGGDTGLAVVLMAVTDGIAVRALVSGMSGSRQRALLRRAIACARVRH